MAALCHAARASNADNSCRVQCVLTFRRCVGQDETLADIRSSLACLTEAVSCIPGCQKALAERDKAGRGGAGRVDRDGNGDGDGGDTGASIPLETSGFWPLGRLFDTPKPSGAFGAAANAETEGVQEGQPLITCSHARELTFGVVRAEEGSSWVSCTVFLGQLYLI